MTTTLENPLGDLRKDLYERPSRSVLLGARWILEIWPREYVPDWVEMLATPDLDKWEKACALAREEIDHEAEDLATIQGLEAEPTALPAEPELIWSRRMNLRELMKPQHGQGVVEVALVLGVVAIILFLLFAWLPTTPAGEAMRGMAADSARQLEAVASMHGMEKHGGAALNVAAELNCSGPIDRIQNPKTGRWANTCQVGDKYGVLIEENDGNCVTCFIKDKMKTYDQVLQYLRNRGYVK